ncbi:MAG: type II toxin-antitoxin system HipA family toxin [Actinomycetia bacterium]|nr:type II toxin-antitoxin system HipA family toxin [Actinomycetes bacterium]
MIDQLAAYLDVPGREPLLVGDAFFTIKAARLVSTTFRYDTGYLGQRLAFPIDPDLTLSTGTQHVNGLPGALEDSAPDRWGRNLTTKLQRHATLVAGRRAASLSDADFLVGVSDFTRQGALRFRADGEGPFLGTSNEVPRLLELPRLLNAADAVSRDDDFTAIKELLEAGSGSLGGARPKASVRDGDRLLIAKFPHPDDDWDVMAWEKTALDLAKKAGIRVPEVRLAHTDGRAVLLLERFDRISDGRVPYMSAMTLLSAHDGDSHDYLEISEALPAVGSAARKDLNELWRRIVFSVFVNNTDDHLRNHGFLDERGGWALSPVFDVNPNPDTDTPRQTTIGGASRREDALAGAHSYAGDFDLDDQAATRVLSEVRAAVFGWRDIAAANSVPEKQMEMFGDAFWTPKKP